MVIIKQVHTCQTDTFGTPNTERFGMPNTERFGMPNTEGLECLTPKG